MGLREKKKERTRDRLIDAALDLISERGLDGTSVEAIAAEAMVSPRTFYRYFGSKEEILTAVGAGLVEDAIGRLPEDPSLAQLVALLGQTLDEATQQERARQLVLLLREHPELIGPARRAWREHAERLAFALAASDGEDAPSYRDRVVASTALNIVLVACDEFLLRNPHVDFARLVDEAVAAILAE